VKKLFAVILVLAFPIAAHGGVTARVGDVTSLKGQGVNYLTGMGLVVGLDGTGDGDEYAGAMRPLAKALEFYANPITSMEELEDTRNVAIVFLTAELPPDGAREGSRLDLQVSPFGKCKSLKGGVLLPTPLLYPDRRVNQVFALAQGKVHLPDPEVATSGTVEDGAVVQEDVIHQYLARGLDLPFTNSWVSPQSTYATLVIQDSHASWTLAREIAQAIDSALAIAADVDHVALAVDPKNVLVLVPTWEVDAPADWIAQIQDLDLLMSDGEARVVVNRTTGTVSVRGNAKISPVIVSHRGLTITIAAPDPDAGIGAAESGVQNFVAIDPSHSGGANINALTEALNRLNVPINDRIAIVTQIHQLGALHAKLVFEE
jgi:flagellar P-ring protein precursor FlgI